MGPLRGEIDELCMELAAEGVADTVAAGFAKRLSSGRWELSSGGATRAIFDLASVTKPMTAFTVARSDFDKRTRLAELLTEARGTPCEDATLEILLAHRSGLMAHVPLYKDLEEGGTYDRDAALAQALRSRRAECEGPIPELGFPPVYSDLGYLLVGEAMRRQLPAGLRDGLGFEAQLDRFVVSPLGLDPSADEALGDGGGLRRSRLDFRHLVVPTEVVPWRGGEIRGVVHDENAFAYAGEGACGHAGMFGTVGALLRFGTAAHDAIERREGPLATGGDLSWLTKERPGGTLRAGFDGKSEDGSSAGTRAGPRTYGHLGFTGTSLWIDPDAEAVVALLTNRVHPTRENVAIRTGRPRAHDALFALAAVVR